jgi:hypothetical protein
VPKASNVTLLIQRVFVIALGAFMLAAVGNYPMRFILPVFGDLGIETASNGIVTHVDRDFDTAMPGARDATLAVGDRIEWTKVPLDDRYGSFRRPLAHTVVSYPFLRDGVEHRATLRARPYANDNPLSVKLTPLIKQIAWIIFVFMAGSVVFMRPSPMTWGFYLYALGNPNDGAAGLSFLPAIPFYAIDCGVTVVNFGAALGLALFALRFPSNTVTGWRSAAELTLWPLLAAYVLLAAFVSYGAMTLSLPWDIGSQLSLIAPAPLYVLAWIALLDSFRRATGAERVRLRWATFGVIIGTLAAGLSLPFLGFTIGQTQSFLIEESFTAFANLAIPATMGYAIVRHRVIDVQFVLNIATVFTIVSLIIVGAFILGEWLMGSWLASQSHITNLAANAVLVVALGLSVRVVHVRVDRFVDNVFFRKRHEDEQAIREFAREAVYATEPDALLKGAVEVLTRHADAASVSIDLDDGRGRYGDVDAGDPVILALRSRHKPVDLHGMETALRGEFAYSMAVGKRLIGVLVLGPKRSGEAYAPDESHAIAELAQAVGTTLALQAFASREDQLPTAIAARLGAFGQRLA